MRFLEKNKPVQILSLVLLVTLCLALPAYFIYQNAKGLIIDELTKNAKNIATTAAIFIEQDIGAYKGLPSDDGTASEAIDTGYYRALMDRFEQIKKESGAASVFTEKRMEDRERAVVFGGHPSPPPGQPAGSSKSMSREELRAFDEGVMTHSDLMWDKSRGEFIAGYAPIIDRRTGEPVGIVGVEFSLKYAGNLTGGIRNIIYLIFLVIMLLTTFVVNSLINSRRKYYKEDYLTGLFNKRYFEKDLTRALRTVRKTGGKLSLIMLDVDRFKAVNDTIGHTAGDSVLKTVAQNMRKHIRTSDFCFRFGGDEFAITLVNTDKFQAFEIAERIRAETEALNLNSGEGAVMTLSIGVAEYVDGQGAEALIECADKALHISKNTGKNRITVYDGAQAAC